MYRRTFALFAIGASFTMSRGSAAQSAPTAAAAQPAPAATAAPRRVSIKSAYLAYPLERFHQVSLAADLADSNGTGTLELDPNACQLNEFGDPVICTLMARVTAPVTLSRLRLHDPSGLARQAWIISGAPVGGTLYLIVPDSPTGQYRLVQTNRAGSRLVISMEPLVRTTPAAPEKITCNPLARKVDSVLATASLHPGIVPNTWFLALNGKKPHANTWVELKPVVYVQQPEYWIIEVLECRKGDIVLPAVMPYMINKDVSQSMGKKGIDLKFANGEILRLQKP